MHRKKARREAPARWHDGSVREFLSLSDEDHIIVELRVHLAKALLARRHAAGMTQAGLSRAIGSSQSRIAKMESADPTVSLDLLIRGLIHLGAPPSDFAAAFRRAMPPRKG